MKTTIGGDRLGSGNKQEVSLKSYGRSTHDMSYVWRSSMASGTLVPFMSELALPGDNFEINLECDVKTLPTVGPLFGSYKVQLDVFECPVRLYNGKLHMNMLNIGMDMSQIQLPQMKLLAKYEENNENDNAQINSSSIYSYLNMRGVGRAESLAKPNIFREFNAVPYLGYWDIYKNYYANLQEDDGVVIHQENPENGFVQAYCNVFADAILEGDIYQNSIQIDTVGNIMTMQMIVLWNNLNVQPWGMPDKNEIKITLAGVDKYITILFDTVEVVESLIPGAWTITCSDYVGPSTNNSWVSNQTDILNVEGIGTGNPELKKFPLKNIDVMREDILKAVSDVTAFEVDYTSNAPYGLGLDTLQGAGTTPVDYEKTFCKSGQEGLGIKTYQSDLFNNWISTEWIDGDNGVNDVSAVLVSQNSQGDEVVTMDALNMSQKVYNMLNRIAVSGGSYDDWLDAVYTHERAKSVESPVYHGSLIRELGFEEVISQGDVSVDGEAQPLGTLAGRGRLSGKNKGGRMNIKVNEPSYIIGIVSITPKVDYSQGNKWDTNLKTMNDFHKPALDEIGYQDLITDQMAWFDTTVDHTGEVKYNSAGKQPAWINYMTNVNQTRGNFAVKDKEMFMTLNRRYEQGNGGIEDVTTYIDPSKYNNIFAQEALDSQNFWVQIGNNIKARRKMSAKVIPNL